MKPPTMVSKNVEPKKLVRVLADVEMLKKMWKYRTMDDMFATNPIFSSAPSADKKTHILDIIN